MKFLTFSNKKIKEFSLIYHVYKNSDFCVCGEGGNSTPPLSMKPCYCMYVCIYICISTGRSEIRDKFHEC